ncbi:MAG: type II toxin-antitoxin system mRNA interferase toxin, RelE/StbE family [Parcubacteria group bacterium]|nr:type II toxin-antitoxin system mRNA interferase toxin, RelE/StbE family [Parcubacteria group bacterium]
MKINYHPRFINSYKKLSLSIKNKAEVKECIFRKNPFDRRLKTHKLHGKIKNLWSFSIDAKYRVVFEFDNSDVIILDVGNHEIYR